MSDSYTILGLESNCDEDAIRHRYLELVRQHSPERDPQRFVEIRQAYEQLRDPIERLRGQLFLEHDEDSLNAMIHDVQLRLRDARIPVETLLSLAEKS